MATGLARFGGAAMILGAALLSTPAAAAPTASQVIADLKAHDSNTGIFMYGMLEGFDTANAALQYKGKPPLYCQPDALVLTLDQVGDILAHYVKKYFSDNRLVGGVMLIALQDAFPCPPAKP